MAWGTKKKMPYFPGAEINWFSIPYTNHLIYFFNVMFLLIKKKTLLWFQIEPIITESPTNFEIIPHIFW